MEPMGFCVHASRWGQEGIHSSNGAACSALCKGNPSGPGKHHFAFLVLGNQKVVKCAVSAKESGWK